MNTAYAFVCFFFFFYEHNSVGDIYLLRGIFIPKVLQDSVLFALEAKCFLVFFSSTSHISSIVFSVFFSCRVADISKEMAIDSSDIVSTLQALGMMKYWKGKHIILKKQVCSWRH